MKAGEAEKMALLRKIAANSVKAIAEDAAAELEALREACSEMGDEPDWQDVAERMRTVLEMLAERDAYIEIGRRAGERGGE